MKAPEPTLLDRYAEGLFLLAGNGLAMAAVHLRTGNVPPGLDPGRSVTVGHADRAPLDADEEARLRALGWTESESGWTWEGRS